MPYLKRFHGRQSPAQDMDGWGDEGPVFGPFPVFHATYGTEIRFNEDNEDVLWIVEGLVYYDEMFYGDWSVFEDPPEGSEGSLLADFDPKLARLPKQYRRCVCMKPGPFNSGVPGILASLDNGRVPSDGKVEHCTLCQRYPDDAAARQKLVELNLIREAEPEPKFFTVHCYVTVRVKLEGVGASTHQDAARLAAAQFDWETNRWNAEYVEEINELLVDLEQTPDYSQSRRFDRDCDEIDL